MIDFLAMLISTVVLAAASPQGMDSFDKLSIKYPIINQFIADTHENFNIDDKSVRLIMSREFYWRLRMSGKNTKKNRFDAIVLTLGWCKHWRDDAERITVITPELLARQREAECFFRSLERR